MRQWTRLSSILVALSALVLLGLTVGCEDKKEDSETPDPTATTTEPEGEGETPAKETADDENAATDEAATDEAPGQAPAADDAPSRAIAVLHGTEGNDGVGGTVTFEQADGGGVALKGTITGLTPGEHGFHVHQWGDCSAPDATSAGGHFNPTGAPHAGPDAEQHHVGDMGNITAAEDGSATIDVTFDFLSFSGPTSVIGRGLIVHAGTDDLESQPSGDAGARVGCAVIGVAEPR